MGQKIRDAGVSKVSNKYPSIFCTNEPFKIFFFLTLFCFHWPKIFILFVCLSQILIFTLLDVLKNDTFKIDGTDQHPCGTASCPTYNDIRDRV